jgi:DNA-directed RNA polymerase subunit RPC12/RpoP
LTWRVGNFAKKRKTMKRLFLLLAFVIPFVGYCHGQSALKNYQCSKCATVVKSDRSPSSLNCRAGGSHQWHNLGGVGQENYCCKKCGTLLESRRSPSTLGCPAKGSHQWNKLGRIGNVTYQCRKCGIAVNNERTPSSLGCPQGGSHQWNKLSR